MNLKRKRNTLNRKDNVKEKNQVEVINKEERKKEKEEV